MEPLLRGRLVGDLLARTADQSTRMDLGVAVLALLLRRYLAALEPDDRLARLEHIVRAVLQ